MAIKKYINTTEAVELTGHSRNEIINLAKTGVLPSHRTRRGHYRLNVDAVEAYFGIQINKPTVVVDKPAPIVKTRAPKVEPRYVEVVTEPAPIEIPATSDGTRLITENFFQEVIKCACAAKSSIKIMTADFNLFRLVPTKKQGKKYGNGTPFLDFLMEKANEGVSVQIISAEQSKYFQNEVERFYRMMSNNCFSVCFCIRNHAKVVIIDDMIAYIGSANMTRAGLGQPYASPGNFEAGIMTENPKFISSLNAKFIKIMNGCYCDGCHRANKCTEY